MQFMKPICLHAKSEIEAFLRQSPFLHLYELGDLDDFFWPYTTWYALKDSNTTSVIKPEAYCIKQIVLFYIGVELPVLLGFTESSSEEMSQLLEAIEHFLPRRFYAHLNAETVKVFAKNYQIHPHGIHYKLGLTTPSYLDKVDTSTVQRLLQSDKQDLEELYRLSYPGNWFDPRMLETGHYYGIRQKGMLVSVAGVHVYSPQYKVAALGNVTTHPDFRKQGLATQVCAKLCKSLLNNVNYIGLNVKADNQSAISCYEQLGFQQIATYGEYMLELKN
jgi:ribosomal protein S18 acetylase RimI-like enzyme